MSGRTPIYDFVRRYNEKEAVRAHMPGHKGRPRLGCEALDITEIKGADALYEARGVIAESEATAAELFGSARTLYSTEGSSQCIKAMLFLAMKASGSRTVLAGRNVHTAFVHACALLDAEVAWLMPERKGEPLCACHITAGGVEEALEKMAEPPFAVFITSPDYLGGIPDIRAIARVCHSRGVPLLVDNAHGAYLNFLAPSSHPLRLEADMCCDSAHKTLPALTGAAYLHISGRFLPMLERMPKDAMAMFGSTSPSYLILQSLDLCNKYITDGYPERLAMFVRELDVLREELTNRGFRVMSSDPLRLTLSCRDGFAVSEELRRRGVEVEYADRDAVVMMLTPENGSGDIARISRAFDGVPNLPALEGGPPFSGMPLRVMSIRDAVFARSETVPVEEAAGRVCAAPAVSCPPAVPVAVSGELITEETVKTMMYYGADIAVVVAEEQT